MPKGSSKGRPFAKPKDDALNPRYGTPPEPGRRYRRRPGVYAALILRDRVLLTHQSRPQPEYQLPGGGVDPGESPLRALHREVLEETGWCIAAPLRIGTYRRFTYMPEYDLWAEKICTLYVARPLLARSAPQEAGHRAEWVPLRHAAAMVASPGDAEYLRRLAV